MARTPLMAGNWKMNLDHLQATHLVQKLAWSLKDASHDYAAVEVAVIPPFTDIRTVQTLVDGDQLGVVYGAQDVSAHAEGAYTGEIASRMLSKLGCSYVVVGHSERRQYHNESDKIVAAKAAATFAESMVPIVCVGEPLDVRKAHEHVKYTLAQVKGSLAGLTEDLVQKVVIAYEPVWAIGTGEVATADDAQEVCQAIREFLRSEYSDAVADAARILYGGSVKPSNVATLMTEQDIDGALVGGASLDPADFASICRYKDHNVV